MFFCFFFTTLNQQFVMLTTVHGPSPFSCVTHSVTRQVGPGSVPLGQRCVWKHKLNMGQWSKRGGRLSGAAPRRRHKERVESSWREPEENSKCNGPARATTPLPGNNRSHIHLIAAPPGLLKTRRGGRWFVPMVKWCCCCCVVKAVVLAQRLFALCVLQ